MEVGLLSSIAYWLGLILTTCLVILCGFLYHRYSYWKKRGVPYDKPYPIIGNLDFLMRRSFWDFCYALKEKHPGDYVGIFLGWRPALVVHSPELARQILVKDHEYFQDRYTYSHDSDTLGSLNLFSLKNPMWSLMRSEVTPMFTASRLKNNTILMNMNATELVKKIQRDYVDANKPVNLKELFLMYTSDTVAYTVFGIRVSQLSDENSPLWFITKHMVKWTFKRGFELIMILMAPGIAAALRFCFFSAGANEYIKKLFRTITNERQSIGSSDRRDLVNYLCKLKDNLKLPTGSDSELTENLILAQAAIFILGAIETSSSTLSYALHEISYNPEAQEKLYNEVKNATVNSGKDVLEYAELVELKYLTACIHETLRKFAPLNYMDRQCLRKYKLNDELTIDEGVPVFVNVLAMHYDEKVYPEPQKWRPERMIGINTENNNFNFLPFGEGPRNCIGKRYGMMQMRAAIAQILLKYKLEPAVPYEVKTDPYSIAISPDKGLSVKFVPR